MKKKWFVIGGIALLAVGVIVAAIAIISGAFPLEVKARTAVIYTLDGEGVVVERNPQDAVYVGMRLMAGDAVVTDEVSMVTIRVDNDKDILLGKSSRMEITAFDEKTLVLTLTEGEFYFNVMEKLGWDETMLFKIGSTSMSIRGTSGGGCVKGEEAQFLIITGAGAIHKDDSEDVEVYVIPQTKVNFVATTGYEKETAEVAAWTPEEQTETMTAFLVENTEYREMLNDNGWEITEEGVIEEEPETVVDDENNKAENFVGWRQNPDGTWYFSQEDFDAGIGPVAYEYSEKPTVVGETSFVADGTEKVLQLSHYNEIDFTVQNDRNSIPGYYTAIITPNYRWADGSKDVIYIDWVILPDSNYIGAFEYNGEEQTIYPEGFDAETMTIKGNVAKKIGTYTVTVAPQGERTNTANEVVTFTWDIVPRVIEIKDVIFTREYNGQSGFEMKTSFAVANQIVKGEKVSLKVTAENFKYALVGEYPNIKVDFVLEGADADNYKLFSNKKSVTIAITKRIIYLTDLTTVTRTYDGNKSYKFDYCGVGREYILDADKVDISVTVKTNDSSVGSYPKSPITVELLGNQASQYQVSLSSNIADVTIEKRSVKLPKAKNTAFTYGYDMSQYKYVTLTYTTDLGDKIEYTYHCDYDYKAGMYPIVTVVDEGRYPNYSFETEDAVLTIAKKHVTIVLEDAEKMYGDPDPVFSKGRVEGLVGNDTIEYTVYREIKGEDVGEHMISAKYDNEKYENYIVDGVKEGILTIKKRQAKIEIKYNSKTKSFYGVESGFFANDKPQYTIVNEPWTDKMTIYKDSFDEKTNNNYNVTVIDYVYSTR